MSKLIFPASPAPTLAIAGSDDRIPVQRVFCVGRNYEDHAKDMGQQVERDEPFATCAYERAAVVSLGARGSVGRLGDLLARLA